MKYLLGVDSGGTITKAGLFDVEGCEIAIAQEPLEIYFPAEGMNERDVNQLKEATFNVIKRVIEESGIDSADIIGISPTGQGNGLFMFDDNGEATRNPIMSGDMRAKDYVKKWNADGIVQDIFLPKTCQYIWAGQPIALLAWVRDHEPETMARSKYAVTCKDYIRFLLTGKFCAELTETSGWSCMDVRKGEYDDELFAAAGLTEFKHLLPPVIKSSDIGGEVTEKAAKETGLAVGTPVMGGMFDINACPLGTGVLDSSKMSIIAGSWSINAFVDTKPSQDIFMSNRYFVPGYYQMSEASATSMSNLEWFINHFFTHEKEAAKANNQNVYDLINEMAAGVNTQDCPIFFLPFLFGTNANIDAKSAFIGHTGIHTRAHMLRAVLEGIVFCHQYHLENLYKIKPADTFSAVRLSGGAVRSELLVQLFADVTNLPIELSQSDELGILGSVICAGIGCGQFQDAEEAVGKFVKIVKTVHPNKEMVEVYKRKYAQYKRIIDALDSAWEGWDNL